VTRFDPRERFSAAWRSFRATTDLDEYDTRWDRMAAEGHDVHGEADFVMSFAPDTVLDAGCGTGRVAIELARRGVMVVGVDLDPDLLERARRRAPDLAWVMADLAEVDLRREFDVVVMAGNVLPFADPVHRAGIVAAMARHVRVDGVLVVGSTLAPGWPTVDDLERWCSGAGLVAAERHAGWQREPFVDRPDEPTGYVVTVHRRPVG